MMNSYAKALGVVLFVAGLAGCGGGGGGGGGPGFVSQIGVPGASQIELKVEQADSLVTPGPDGVYEIAPGQKISVSASKPVKWSGSSADDAVKRSEVGTSETAWVSRLFNTGSKTPVIYTLTARSADGLSGSIRMSVKPGDPRNGDYRVFAANGSRQSLFIDFDLASFEMTDPAGVKTEGTLSIPEAPADAYGMSSGRAQTPTNVSSLRAFGDTIVGSFPFEVPFSSPASYKAYPFIASRALVTTQANIDGIYNRMRVDGNATGRDSFIGQFKLSGGGTVLTQCNDNGIYLIERCPAKSTYIRSVERDTDTDTTGLWNEVDPVSGTRVGRFAVARMADQNVVLTAGPLTFLSVPTAVFSVALPELADWTPFGLANGWSTNSTIDEATSTEAAISLSAISASGSQTRNNFTLGAVGGPKNLRVGSDGSNGYFAMRSNSIEVLVGARGNPATQGFMHIGVIH